MGFLCTLAAPALAAGNDPHPPTPVVACGATTREAIASAEAALQLPGDSGVRAALACLVRAVTDLDKGQPIVAREGARNGALHVPTYSRPRPGAP